MKLRKLFAVCIALMIVLGSVATVNAAESVSATVSEDPAVQDAYAAFLGMSEALNVHEYDSLKNAFDEYNAITEAFTDEQSDEWNRVVEDVIGYDEALPTLICTSMIVDTVAKQDAYQDSPDAKTAHDFIYMYEECVSSEIRIDLFVPGIESVYETAKTVDAPSEGTLAVYDAYLDLGSALAALECGFYDEDFINACAGFEAVLDIFNELTEDEMTDLACLMEVADSEEAFGVILSDWINANIALELGAVYDAYQNDLKDEEAASEFVAKYEEILNDTQMLTDEDKAVILTSFESAYEGAKEFLAEAGDQTDESDPDHLPETGDNFSAVPFITLLVFSAAAAALMVKRREVQ